MSTVAVLGAGSFGTTLAIHLATAGHDTRLWGRDPAAMAQLGRSRENAKFLAGIHLPHEVKVHAELEAALDRAEFHLFVVPSQATRSVAARVAATGARAMPVCASKGLELGTLRRIIILPPIPGLDSRTVTLEDGDYLMEEPWWDSLR